MSSATLRSWEAYFGVLGLVGISDSGHSGVQGEHMFKALTLHQEESATYSMVARV